MLDINMNRYLSSLVLAIYAVFSFPAFANDSTVEKYVNSIQSVDQVKQQLRDAFESLDTCPSGSCVNTNTTEICELVGALDARLDSAITGTMTSPTPKPAFLISSGDLKLMKLIYAQCKPTNYQYWNYPTVLHVGYAPSKEANAKIRKALGVKPQ